MEGSPKVKDPTQEVVAAIRDLALPTLAEVSSTQDVLRALGRERHRVWSRSWTWDDMIKAVLLRDKPREQAKIVAAIREQYARRPADQKEIEAHIERLFAKW